MKNLNKFLIILCSFILVSCSESTVDPGGKITVNGKVYTNDGGIARNVTVKINGSESHVSNDGSFSISGVESPYDLMVLEPSNAAYIYKGLSISNPLVTIYGSENSMSACAMLVTLPFVLQSNQKALFYFKEEPGTLGPTTGVFRLDSVTYSFYQHWNEGPVIRGSFYILIITTNSNSEVVSYDGFYKKENIELHAGVYQYVTPSLSEFTNPGEATYTGNLVLPPGTAFGNMFGNFSLTFRDQGTYLDGNPIVLGVSGTSYSIKVPTGIPASFRVIFAAYAASSYNYIFALQEIGAVSSVRMDNGPQSISPSDGQNISLRTPFTWTAGEGTGIYEFQFNGNGKFYSIISSSTESILPSLASHGLGIVQGQDYFWTVRKLKGYQNINVYARDPFLQKNTGIVTSQRRRFVYSLP